MTHTLLNREMKYQGRAFDVSSLTFQLPDGRQRSYDLVEHSGSVTIVPVDDQDNLYFVSQHRIGAGEQLLELPAGVLEAGEDPMVCAMREIREEIGMAAYQLTKLGGFYLAPGYSNEHMTIFLATGLFDSPLDPDADEFLDVVRMPISDAYHAALQGEFSDSKTLAALLLAMPHLDVSKLF